MILHRFLEHYFRLAADAQLLFGFLQSEQLVDYNILLQSKVKDQGKDKIK
jgi:hypothetical protein